MIVRTRSSWGCPKVGLEQVHLTVAPFPPATSGQGQISSLGRAVSDQLLSLLSVKLHQRCKGQRADREVRTSGGKNEMTGQ